MIFKTFSTNWNDKYEFSNDIIFEYEYEGVDDVPYLSEAFSIGVGDGSNYLILAIDECNDTIMGAVMGRNVRGAIVHSRGMLRMVAN